MQGTVRVGCMAICTMGPIPGRQNIVTDTRCHLRIFYHGERSSTHTIRPGRAIRAVCDSSRHPCHNHGNGKLLSLHRKSRALCFLGGGPHAHIMPISYLVQGNIVQGINTIYFIMKKCHEKATVRLQDFSPLPVGPL